MRASRRTEKRFALQIASFSGTHSVKRERFGFYAVDTGELIAGSNGRMNLPRSSPGQRSHLTAQCSSSGLLLKLTLYRLP